MPRPQFPAIDAANDPHYSLASGPDLAALLHDLDDDEEDVEFDADDRHGGVQPGFGPEAA